MKILNRIICLVCCFNLVAVTLLAQSLDDYNLTQDTAIKLITVDRLKSGACRKKDRVRYNVDEDVLDSNGNILIKKGTPAYGEVLNSRGAGAWGKRGALDVSVEYTTAVDGQKVNLTATKGKRGGGKPGLITAGVLLCPIILAIPLGFSRGSNVTIEPGTTFVAYIDDKLKINPHPLNNNQSINQISVMNKEQNQQLNLNGQIKLKNGNSISGKILSITNNYYVIETELGVLQLDKSKVESVNIVNDTNEDNNRDSNIQNMKQKLNDLRNRNNKE